MCGNCKYATETKEVGNGTSSIDADISNLSLIISKDNDIQTILNKFDIIVGLQEIAGLKRDITVKINPIEVKLSLLQILFFQQLADRMQNELKDMKLDFGSPANPAKEAVEPPLQNKPTVETASKEVPPIQNNINLNIAKMKLVLEDDLQKYPYPLLKSYMEQIALTGSFGNSQSIDFHVFEAGIEIGAMLDASLKENVEYPSYFKLKHKEFPENTIPYKEIM